MNEHHQEEQQPPRPFWRMPFRKLAMRYFPKVLPQVANRYLRRILNSDPLMLRDLEQSGYRPYQQLSQCRAMWLYSVLPRFARRVY